MGGARALASRAPRGRSSRRRARRADPPVPLALPGPDALQLGRRAVRPRAARVRRRQAPASPAGIPALRGARPPAEQPRGRSQPGLCLARDALQRRHDDDGLLAGARALRPRDGGVGGRAAGGQPAFLVLRLGRADLCGRGLRRLAGRRLRLRRAPRRHPLSLWGSRGAGLGRRHPPLGPRPALPALRGLRSLGHGRGHARRAATRAGGRAHGQRRALVVHAHALADRRARRVPPRLVPALRLGGPADLRAGRLARRDAGAGPLRPGVRGRRPGTARPGRFRAAALRAARRMGQVESGSFSRGSCRPRSSTPSCTSARPGTS